MALLKTRSNFKLDVSHVSTENVLLSRNFVFQVTCNSDDVAESYVESVFFLEIS